MTKIEDIFDPRHYEKVRLPLLDAESLPPWCYTSREFYDREVDRIFMRSWNFLGREDEVAKPGDYAVFDLFGESVIVVRARDNKVRAFANSCRHRGTRLLQGNGSCRAIVCPYHGWGYNHNGELVGAAGMEDTHDFERHRYSLHPVRIETWEGFIFVNFDAMAGGLLDYLGDLPERLKSYNFGDMVCVRRREYQLACNWKIFLENAMEDYHTPVVHKQSIGIQVTRPEVARGEWGGIYLPAEKTIAVLAADLDNAFPPIPTLNGRPVGGTYFLVIYPSTFFATTQDCMWWLQQFPQGPDRTKLVVGSCFPRATVARSDFEERVQYYFKRWDKSIPEDNAISEQQQLGMRSSYASAGRFSIREPLVRDIANWILDRTLG